jgi:hypothetical protein
MKYSDEKKIREHFPNKIVIILLVRQSRERIQTRSSKLQHKLPTTGQKTECKESNLL